MSIATARALPAALLAIAGLLLAGCSAGAPEPDPGGSTSSPAPSPDIVVGGSVDPGGSDPGGSGSGGDPVPASDPCSPDGAEAWGFSPVSLPAGLPDDVPLVAGPCDYVYDLGIGAGGVGNILFGVAVGDASVTPIDVPEWQQAQQLLAAAGYDGPGNTADNTAEHSCARFVKDEITGGIYQRQVTVCVHRQGSTSYNVIDYDVLYVV